MADAYAASRDRALASLRAHVDMYQDVAKQGSKAWLAKKSRCVGGSEIGALLGLSPFNNRIKMLAKKAGLDNSAPPGIACWWGTMFEPVTENLLAYMFRTPVIGTDIHIRCEALPAHANSPDGYAVIPYVEIIPGDAHGPDHKAPGDAHGPDHNARGGAASRWEMCFELEAAFAAKMNVMAVPALIELKAPYSRIPKGTVPKYYVPQLLSGMALSPPVAVGIYAEVVYRLAALTDLTLGTAEYCASYHFRDAKAAKRKGRHRLWEAPLAIGVSAFYAPRIGTRRSRQERATREKHEVNFAGSLSQKGVDQLCLELVAKSCGHPITREELGVALADISELADRRSHDFTDVMAGVNRGEVVVEHTLPVMMADHPEGGCPGDITRFMEAAAAKAPDEDHYLMGFMGWKVFQADVHQIDKRPNYVEEVLREPIESFISDLEHICSADSPMREYHQLVNATLPSVEERLRKSGAAEHVKELFAMCAAAQ